MVDIPLLSARSHTDTVVLTHLEGQWKGQEVQVEKEVEKNLVIVMKVGSRMTLYRVIEAAKDYSRHLACRATWRAWIVIIEGIGVDASDDKPVPSNTRIVSPCLSFDLA